MYKLVKQPIFRLACTNGWCTEWCMYTTQKEHKAKQ